MEGGGGGGEINVRVKEAGCLFAFGGPRFKPQPGGWIDNQKTLLVFHSPRQIPHLYRELRYYKFNVRTVHIRRSRNDQQYALILPLLYSVYWLLHVSAVACNQQGAS
jgi:hypothetical protein